MRIVCPDCAAAYEVPDSMLAAPRTLRCARCGREWSPRPATPDEADRIEPVNAMPGQPSLVEPAAVPADTRPPAPAIPEQPLRPAPGEDRAPRRALGWTRNPVALARAGWAGSLILLLVLAWAAYTWRGAIIHVWPPSERLYLALGMA